jgi:MoaA/NifB/PqqE/SkfB family radical SAM enzyme
MSALDATIVEDRASRLRRALRQLYYALLPDWLLVRLTCLKLPRSATLEVTTACNLRCPLCPTHDTSRGGRQLGPDAVANVVAGCGPRLKVASFHVLGEPLLNRELFALVRHCEDHGVRTSFSTNGMLLHRHLDAILDSGLSHLSIAIDGVTPQDYARYRVGGDLDTVLDNVRALLAARAARGASRPVVQVRMIMFSYNEDQESRARAFLESLGADAVSLKRPSYAGPRTDAARDFLAQVDRGGETGGRARRWARPDVDPALLFRNRRLCPQLERPTVLADGKLVACGVDAQGESAYGNVNASPFRELWRSAAHRRIVRSFLRRELAPCARCTLTDREPPPAPA